MELVGNSLFTVPTVNIEKLLNRSTGKERNTTDLIVRVIKIWPKKCMSFRSVQAAEKAGFTVTGNYPSRTGKINGSPVAGYGTSKDSNMP